MKNLHLRSAVSSAALLGPMTAAERATGRYMRAPDTHSSLEGKSIDDLAAEVKADFDKRFDEVKAIAEAAVAKADKAEALTEEEKARADNALTEFNESRIRLAEVEQKLARRGVEQNGPPKSAGYQFIESDEVKAFCANPTSGRRVGVEVKAVISGDITDTTGAAGDLVVPQRGMLVAPPERRLTVRDLLTPGRTSSSSIQYPVETLFTNAAATVAETGLVTKPQSDLKFDIRTSAVTTIAHWVLATRQILDDAPMLQSYIDGRLRYGLLYAEELQLLHGDGLGTNLNGIYTQAVAMTDPGVLAMAQKLDVLRFAMLQAALAEYPASGFVLHPTDWAGIELTKDTTGRYIIGDPKSEAPARVWGLPVVATQAMLVGKFLCGAFKMGAQIFDRQDARVEISTEDSDNFRKNLVTILAEERLALAVYRPAAFVKGDFAAMITALAT
jgi:HK97 family phage major capsid protein